MRQDRRKELLRKLWAMAKRVYEEEADTILHDRAWLMFGKESLRELDEYELTEMCRFVYEDLKRYEEMRKKHGALSSKQEWLINKLARKLFESNVHFRHWLERWFGVSHPKWLSRREARDVIHALMMIEKKRGLRRAA